MEYYKNLNGNSSIIAYKTYDDKINTANNNMDQ